MSSKCLQDQPLKSVAVKNRIQSVTGLKRGLQQNTANRAFFPAMFGACRWQSSEVWRLVFTVSLLSDERYNRCQHWPYHVFSSYSCLINVPSSIIKMFPSEPRQHMDQIWKSLILLQTLVSRLSNCNVEKFISTLWKLMIKNTRRVLSFWASPYFR